MGHLDVLIIGSGAAGLTAAVRAAEHGMSVGVLTKGVLAQSATRWAQGGIAAVLGEDEDSADQHLADTLAAGAGLCDVDAVRVLVDEGPDRVHELIGLGAMFDRDASGALERAKEGGHSHARVVHAGGAATGVEVERALVAAVSETAAAVMEGSFARELMIRDGRCRGVISRGAAGGEEVVEARNVLLATGGAGQLYSVTTNPHESTGDSTAMALRAGVAVADIEFMQFHPTALHHPAMPRPLLSEALRGHGAILRDARGERFVDELAPRDKVSQAMAQRMADQSVEHLWLDATGLERFDERFPTIAASLSRVGLDPSKDWLPIAPAAHYLAGGVVVDLDGASALPGLWACGEAACSGVHGANRLASNSLLDCMVFGARAVDAIARGKDEPEATGAMRAVLRGDGGIPGRRLAISARDVASGGSKVDADKARDELQRVMTRCAGVVRSAGSLDEARAGLVGVEASLVERESVGALEVLSLIEVAWALVAAATAREESRGAHARSDFPDASPSFLVRLVFDSDTLPVPRFLSSTSTGEPMPDVVSAVRRSREGD